MPEREDSANVKCGYVRIISQGRDANTDFMEVGKRIIERQVVQIL